MADSWCVWQKPTHPCKIKKQKPQNIEKKEKTLNGIFRLFSGLEEGNCLGNEHCGFKTWTKHWRAV